MSSELPVASNEKPSECHKKSNENENEEKEKEADIFNLNSLDRQEYYSTSSKVLKQKDDNVTNKHHRYHFCLYFYKYQNCPNIEGISKTSHDMHR